MIAALIASAGISRHGDQQHQSSKCAFQHHDHSVGPEPQRRGEPGVPADACPKGAVPGLSAPRALRGAHVPQCCRNGTTGKTLRPFRNYQGCPALRAKINIFPKSGREVIYPAIPPRHEGRDGHSSPDVRRVAMDAWRRKTCGATRTVKPCGPDPPTLGSSLVDESRYDDGG